MGSIRPECAPYTYKRWEILPWIHLCRLILLPHKAYFNDATQSASSQHVSKVAVDSARVCNMLSMALESSSCQNDQNGRNHRSLSIPAQYNAQDAGCPPDDAHRCMLIIAVVPVLSPSINTAASVQARIPHSTCHSALPVLCKCIDDAPCQDHPAIIPLLALAVSD